MRSSVLIWRVNGKIAAREVRVIGKRGGQLGIMPLATALNMARSSGVDLVEVAPNTKPPVCRLVDYCKFRHGLGKRRKKQRDKEK